MAAELFLPPDHAPSNGSYDHTNGHGSSKSGDPDISWPLERPAQHGDWTPRVDAEVRKNSLATAYGMTVPLEDLLPGKRRSQSGIGTRSFLLGMTLGLCIPLTAAAAMHLDVSPPSPTWRISFLLAMLSIFHFLEYWTHARYNVPKAYISSFLLFNNGWQYTAANAATLLETTVTSIFFPRWQARFSNQTAQLVAFVVMLVGQTCRSTAMAHAGTSFNHKVQTRRARDHELVTTGIYSFLRHPSYFGFFWWAVGLQVVLGNAICFWIYALVLWKFFHDRIPRKTYFISSNSVSRPRERRLPFFSI